ncbi:MAG: alpha/beta hydrolase [Deltaproteobacteria bacterium]|nr:alpha/beta hydrolase [Deltaproteobacteria bacterium]
MAATIMAAAVTVGATCAVEDGSADRQAATGSGGGKTPGQGGIAGQGGSPSGTDAGPLGGGGVGGTGGAVDVTDFHAPGPYAATVEEGTVPMASCGVAGEMAYTLFVPAGAPGAPLVVLGHGFNRARQNMAEMAAHMASHGVRVVTPDLCHASIADTDHRQNGVEQVALAAALTQGAPVIHAGYSAGGLAAILATAQDSTAVALLALDAVDDDGLAVAAAPTISVPTLGIEGEPSSCNKQNNGGTSVTKLVPGGAATVAVGATHCDFEGPTGILCTGLCGGEGQAGQRQLIRAMATAFVAWQAGTDSTGEDWVTSSGASYQALEGSGAIATR